MRGCILTMMIGGEVDTIFGFQKEDDALQWIKGEVAGLAATKPLVCFMILGQRTTQTQLPAAL
jgi:hypothetical protein